MAFVQIFFGPNQTTLTPDAVATLQKLAAQFKKDPPKAIAISGNADSKGQAAANLTISRKRGEAVQRFLIDNGIAAETTKVFANGSSLPAATDDTEEGRAANRRVDIVTRGEVGTAVGAALGDRGEKEGEAPPLQPAQGELPLASDAIAVGANTPWVAGEGILAPPRTGNDAVFFVDGRDFMADVADKIRKANKIIYITDWAFSPFIHLIRSGSLQEVDRLLSLLQTAVVRNVVVRVMLWDSEKKHSNNRDAEAESVLEPLGIRVHRHQWVKDFPANRFSHHQKTIIMDSGDSRVAYIGGLDLTSGRWDTAAHPVVADPAIWPDQSHADLEAPGHLYHSGDFYSKDLTASDIYDEKTMAAHRERFPRQPWHDVHARISGPAARDVEVNFVQRWNFQPSEAPLLPPPAVPAGTGKQVVQIVRSASPASIGPGSAKPVEASIHTAYINAIRMSQHHIYIENQFFTSSFADNPIHNQLMIELATRIATAIKNKQKFRVKILLPVHPEGVVFGGSIDDTVGTQELMHWQYRTLVRPAGTRKQRDDIAPESLVGRVLASLGGNTPQNRAKLPEFLGIYNVRNHGTLSGGTTVTEQVYVHAKLMIVDDRVVIVGSANINDRSLLGSRDTELSAIIVDNDTTLIPIDGKNRFVRNYAHKLRLQLWQEHLGLSSADTILDPIADETHKLWHETAERNTEIYEAVFPNIASNRFADVGEQQKAAAFDPSQKARLSQLKGHLTLHPLDYLRNEDLETTAAFDELFTFLETGSGGGVAVV